MICERAGVLVIRGYRGTLNCPKPQILSVCGAGHSFHGEEDGCSNWGLTSALSPVALVFRVYIGARDKSPRVFHRARSEACAALGFWVLGV